MKRAMRFGASAALLILCAQPCLAAEDFRDRADGERHSAAFAGATVRLPFGSATERRPTARLQLTVRHTQESRSAAPRIVTQPAGLEFGATQRGGPSLFVGGLDFNQIQRQLAAAQGEGSSKSDRFVTGALVLGGLVVGGIILAITLTDQTDPEEVTTSPPRD